MSGNDYGNPSTNDNVDSLNINTVIKSLRSRFEQSLIEQPFHVNNAQLHLTHSATGQGGTRYWFICPLCVCRVAVVYYDVGLFACRRCLAIKYPSSRYKGMIEEKTTRGTE